MGQKEKTGSITITITIPKVLLSLVNFWPAVLVGLTLLLALPKTEPVLQEIPEKLVMTKAEAAQTRPALPDPETGPEKTEEPAPVSGRAYTDGVYEGSSRGYGGTITVRVTVEQTKITKIDILTASGETSSYLNRAKKVIDSVIASQTWEVDTVSGATYSSRGILGAIKNALTGEKVENEKPKTRTSAAAPLTKEDFDDSASWKDGVYTGSAAGFGGTIKVEVTVTGGKIGAIRVLSHSGETSSYFNKAKAVIEKIISRGTPNVDTISGATYSSNGIINAVKNALKKAAGDQEADEKEEGQNTENTDPASEPENDETKDPDVSKGLRDGVWSEDVVCKDGKIFDYTIRITMTVKNGKIITITVKKMEDRSDIPGMNETYLNYALSGRTVDGKNYEGIVNQILKLQTTKGVDAVSGATWSSNAIIKGVKKLLARAAEKSADDGEDEKDEKDPDDSGEGGTGEEPSERQDEEPEKEPESGYKDGIYSMESQCADDPSDPMFDYTVCVTIVLKDDEIKYIQAERSQDRSENPDANETYFGYAVHGRTKNGTVFKSIIDQILEKQTTNEIDLVSGATFSSRTIVQAVRELLKQAAVKPSGEETGEEAVEEDDPEIPDGENKIDVDETGSETGDGEDGGENSSEGSGGNDSGVESGDGGNDSGDSNGGSGDGGNDSGDSNGGSGDGGQGQDSALWKDGSYTVDVSCTEDGEEPLFDYTLRITTVIENKKIVSVSVERIEDRSEEPDDNTGYIQRAKEGRTWKGVVYRGIPDQILSAQSTSGIDTVSGATWSSRAVIQGVREALEKACKEALKEAAEAASDQEDGPDDTGEPGGSSGSGTDKTEEVIDEVSGEEPDGSGEPGSGTDKTEEVIDEVSGEEPDGSGGAGSGTDKTENITDEISGNGL